MRWCLLFPTWSVWFQFRSHRYFFVCWNVHNCRHCSEMPNTFKSVESRGSKYMFLSYYFAPTSDHFARPSSGLGDWCLTPFLPRGAPLSLATLMQRLRLWVFIIWWDLDRRMMVEIFSIGRRRCASRFLFISSTWAFAVLWYLMRNNASSPICRRALLNKAALCPFIATVFHLNDPSCIIGDATLLKLARYPLFHHSLSVQLLGRSECSVNCKFFGINIISIKLIFGCLRGLLGVY